MKQLFSIINSEKLKKTISQYPWKFMGFLIIAMLIPKIYELTNVYWIGRISLDALAITEQYEFLGVTIEIVNETIPFGVLALVAQNYSDKQKIISILKAGIIFHLAFSILVANIVILFTPEFVATIGTPTEIVTITSNYLILRALALPFDSVAILLLIGIKAMQKGKEALYLITISVIINMILDLLFISNFSFSLQLGINGVAIGYFLSKLFLMALSALYLFKILDITIQSFLTSTWKTMAKPIFKIGSWTGIDSLVRNVGYIGQLTILNLLGTDEFAGYGLAMTVMWTLIIPMLALTEGTNVVVGNYYGQKDRQGIKNSIAVSMVLSVSFMVIIGFLGVFFWNAWSMFFNENPAVIDYSNLTFWWLIIPYIIFAISNILRSIFIGTGKTYNILILGSIANFLIILPYVFLVRLGFIIATFEAVMILFVIVFILDPLFAYILARRVYNGIDQTNDHKMY